MAITEPAARAALAQVREPELDRDLVAAQMVKRVVVEGDRVRVAVELLTPACRHRDAIEREARAALAAAGAGEVVIEFSANVLGRRAGPNQARLPGVRNVVAVASGKGGVGKSTVATNLALALRRHGASVGLLDADVFGPSIPGMLGEPQRAARPTEQGRIEPALYHDVKVISIGFFVERDGAVIWRGPMVHKLLEQFVTDVDWGELDYLVCDLPPGTGDVQLSLAQLIPIAGAVMVTTPQEVAIMDVVRGVAMFRKTEVPIAGVIENMSYYVCPGCGHHDEIFARGGGRRLAEQAGVPFLGEIPLDTRIRAGGDVGRPVVVAAPDGEIAHTYMEIAGRAACRLAAMNFAAPKRSPGLVAIR